jgi:hypothetical protein
VEQALYNAMRALEERQMLLEQLARQEPDPKRAARLQDDHARARDAVATVRDLIRSTVAAAAEGVGK